MAPLTPSSKNKIGQPLLGFGTFQSSNEEAKQSSLWALQAGYRHLDTAEFYMNEKGVGDAIKESGLPREEIFITTKLWPGYVEFGQKEKTYDDTVAAVKKQLELLQVDQIDLYLLHQAFAKTRIDQYRALVDMQKEGKLKHIGVSNWGVVHLEQLEEAGLPTPAANQLELHPLCMQKKTREYMELKGIVPIAYSSMAPLPNWRAEDGQGGDKTAELRKACGEVAAEVAKSYGQSANHVLLRWALQHGFAIIPKSTKQERIQSNMDLFGFELSEDDMAKLDALDANKPLAWSATQEVGFDPMKVVTELEGAG